jgi:hypothetical protein
MHGSPPSHHLKGEPEFELWPVSQKFSCYYDYDQLRDRKLTGFTDQQKAVWFIKRIEMTFLDPLRAIFLDPQSQTFKNLMSDELAPSRSFSIAVMSVMLNGVEALGSFLEPDLGDSRGDNKRMFESFVEKYLPVWWRKAVSSGTPNVTDLIWKNFRNGVAHGFQISPPGSLEFLETEPFRWESQMKVVQVCPLHFFNDLDLGVRRYCLDLKSKQDVLEKFIRRFKSVYPH